MTLRIDAHQHFWRYRAEDYPWIGAGMDVLAQDKLPAELLPLLRRHELGASIAVQARSGREETRFLLDLAKETDWIAGVVGWENLGVADLEERLSEWRGGDKLVGFRHQVQDEADARAFLGQADFNRGIALLQAQQYVYDVLVFEHQLADTLAFCARHDKHWLVLDHLGKPALREFGKDDAALKRWKKELLALGKLPHVACKLSGLVTEADWQAGLQQSDYDHIRICLDTALEAFGPQRLMFGSDWPVCLLAASYDKVVELVAGWAAAHLNREEQAALWGGTAARCYGIAA
ncbi:amidohydrolase [Herbaspirillum sp. RV1423]|uniref:amidohydrolase family protein n=1 Tax=Herbaspirillum sp. RV1423 TaxID=1443993 RepID=UPI00054D5CEC|nr:amidohydrolase family protein [Herbaspirillum sp. RV1423]